MNKNQSILLLIVGIVLAFFFFRKKDPDLARQQNNPGIGGGGGSAPPLNVPKAPVGNVIDDAFALGRRIIGLFPSRSVSTSPEAAYVGAVQQPVGGSPIPTAPSASAVMISGFDAAPSFYEQYAGYV